MKIPNSVALAPVASLDRSQKKIDTAGTLVCQPKFEVHDMKLPTFIVPIAVTGLYWSRGCFSAGKTKRTANLNPMAHRLSVPPFNVSRPMTKCRVPLAYRL